MALRTRFRALPTARTTRIHGRRVTALLASVAAATAGATFALPTAADAVPICSGSSTPALEATVACTYPGSYTLTVPTGTTSVDTDVIGAGGGAGYPARQHIGGNAAEVSGVLTLPAGTRYLTVIVGAGGGGNNHGYGYGGTGSGVFALDSSSNLIAKLAIAGAGGGGAYNGDGGNAGNAAGAEGGSENQVLAHGGFGGTGAVGGSGGPGNYSVGQAGNSDNSTAVTIATGGAGGTYPNQSAGGSGGGGYGGGGGGGTGNQGILTVFWGGGGGGSSLASSYLGSASVAVKAGTGGIQLPGLVASDGQTGSVTMTFHGLAVPGSPTAVSATPGNTQASVSFTAPDSDGGSPITSYTVTSAPGGLTATCPGSPCVVTGLTNGTGYTFTVHATNTNGVSAESTASSTVTPATPPGAPTAASATAGAGAATVSFTAPASNGGSAVTSYTVTSSPGGVTKTCSASPCTVTGLTNGTTYAFSVKATNAVGDSVASAPTSAVTPRDVPGAPTSVSVQPGDGQATVTFTAPASNGGSAITGYTVTTSPGGATHPCSASPCTVTGLTNGTGYTFTVHATNALGDSAESSATAAVTPAAVPGAPTAVSATSGNGSAEVSFTAPSADGGSSITGYTVTASPGGAHATCVASPCTVNGLDNGTSYTFTVVATNAIGDSTPSTPSAAVTPATIPEAPGTVDYTPADGSIQVAFPTPPNGGEPITRYQATVDGGDNWFDLTPVTVGSDGIVRATITSLTNGTTYQLQVRAINAVGVGDSTPSQSVVPATAPGAPTSVSVTSGNGSAEVSFTAPVSNGGSTITSYTVTASPGGLTATCPGSPCTVTGLTNGTSYTFTVKATNPVGDSAASTPSASVTPATVPSVPGSVTVTPSDAAVDITFDAPATGGSAITGYEVSLDDGTTWVTLPTTPANGRLTGHVGNLTNGTTYPVRVRAVNAEGPSSASDAQSVVPATAPGAPTSVSVTSGNGSAEVSFTAPVSDGGSTITSYTVTASPGGLTATCPGSPCTVTGLTNGTSYTFTVKATNPVGDSAASTPSASVTPATVPSVPGSVTVTPSDAAVDITFDAPATGGSAITGYEVSLDDGTTWVTLPTTPANGRLTGHVGNLTNGTTYPVRVRAVNAEGPSSASDAQSVVPATAPGAPTDVTAVAGAGNATVSFTAPVSNGGSTITSYTVTSEPGHLFKICPGSPCTVDNLTNGTSYTFTVQATNEVGSSTASLPSAAVTPVTVAAAPGDLRIDRTTAAAVTVSFTAPSSDGGSPITGYQVSTDGGLTWNDAPTTTDGGRVSVTVDSLEADTAYHLAVRALNAQGPGAATEPVSTATRPVAVDALTVVAGTASATVAWRQSTSTSVTGYSVYASPGAATCTTSSRAATSCVIGATAGVSYTYTVIAHSPAGDSEASQPSETSVADAPVVPATAPLTAPTTLTTTKGVLHEVHPGQQITVVGTGFLPLSSATVIMYSTPEVLAHVVTDSRGAFRRTVTVPADLASGSHNLVASGVDRLGADRQIRMPVVVPAAVTSTGGGTVTDTTGTTDTTDTTGTTDTTSSSPSDLASTGVPINMLVTWSVLIMGAGLALLQLGRRRRTQLHDTAQG